MSESMKKFASRVERETKIPLWRIPWGKQEQAVLPIVCKRGRLCVVEVQENPTLPEHYRKCRLP